MIALPITNNFSIVLGVAPLFLFGVAPDQDEDYFRIDWCFGFVIISTVWNKP